MGADSYWARRSIEREEEWNRKSRETVEKELASHYERSAQRIQAQIEQLYGKFATDNGVSITEARKLINGNEFRIWRKDIEEYIAEYKETGNPKTLLELNTLAMRSRISRLDKLYGDTLIELDKLGQKTDATITGFLKDAYKDNRLHSAYELAKRGQGPLSVAVDNKQVEHVLRTPWSGKNYSERIWKNSDKLARTIQDTIVNGVHRGVSVNKLAKEVQERMNVSKNDAVRLVRTEMNYVNNQAALDSIKDAKMKYYQFIATLDKRTSSTCREHDGKVYLVSEAEIGNNVPPLHPRCRSTIAGTLGPAKPTKGSRIAKDEPQGKGEAVRYKKVPRNMDYDDWKAVYVDRTKTLEDWQKERNPNPKLMPKTDTIVTPNPMSVEQIRNKIIDINLQTATPKDIIEVGKIVNDKHDIVSIIGDKKSLKKVFSEYRDIGAEIPKTMWAKGSSEANKELLQEAFSVYPSDWLQYLKAAGKGISTRKIKRGYFYANGAVTGSDKLYYVSGIETSELTKYITINMNGVRRTTPFHEIGHMVEYFNYDALRLSREFVEHRTKGEGFTKLKDLFPSSEYRADEVVKADNFITPYIGKDYGNNGTEVLSVGLESLFEPDSGQVQKIENGKYILKTITDDEEYLNFIIGMVLTV